MLHWRQPDQTNTHPHSWSVCSAPSCSPLGCFVDSFYVRLSVTLFFWSEGEGRDSLGRIKVLIGCHEYYHYWWWVEADLTYDLLPVLGGTTVMRQVWVYVVTGRAGGRGRKPGNDSRSDERLAVASSLKPRSLILPSTTSFSNGIWLWEDPWSAPLAKVRVLRSSPSTKEDDDMCVGIWWIKCFYTRKYLSMLCSQEEFEALPWKPFFEKL